MAGGKGTRMRPLTCELPKPMVPVLNRPILEYLLLLLKQYDINDIAMTLMYLPQKIMDYFGDGSKWGVNLKYYVEDTPLGTAGSIMAASDFLDDTFIVLSGDCMTDVNLSEAITQHKEKKAAVTMVLKRVDFPLDYGIAITNPEGYITEFFEKPSWSEVFSDTANTGIYIIEPWVMKLFDMNPPADFSRDIFPKLLEAGCPIYGYITNDYWNDIGGLDSYVRTHHDFLERRIHFEISGRNIHSRIWIGENTQIDPTAIIRNPCFIGSNCRIGANVLIDGFTVIGDNCIIENDSSIRKCILWNNCYVDYASELRGCVLGNHAQIMHHVSAFENTVIGDETLVRERTVIKANIKIWPRKYIEPQSVVDRSIIWANRLTRVLFGQRGLSGVLNVDLTPEFASRLGSAYGSVVGRGKSIVVSYDHSDSARLIRLAFLSGLISVGVNAYDMEGLFIPLSRMAVQQYGMGGGVHIMQNLDSPERLQILFYDSSGIEADKTVLKSIEASYFKEEFKRCTSKDVARVTEIRDYPDIYIESLINKVDCSSIGLSKPKICISSGKKEVTDIMARILTKVGCEVVSQVIVESFSPFLLMQEIDNKNAMLGGFIDGNGDKLILMDATGRIIRDDQLFMLTAYILFKSEPGFTLLAPVNMTMALEMLACSNGGNIRWTKTGADAQMKALIEMESNIRTNPQYILQYDSFSSLSLIISFLCRDGTTLEEVMNHIPSYRVETTSIHCPWEHMGKVMRLLISEAAQGDLDLMDGIKINGSGFWVLVLPDPEQPMMQIFAEGKNARDTGNILKQYTTKIETYIEEGSQTE